MSTSKTWTVELSDGKVFTEKLEDPGAWRNILNYANDNNCTVNSVKFNGEEIDDHPGATHYFVINDAMTNAQGVMVRCRKGFGSLRVNGKARLRWEVVKGHESGGYTEVVTPNNNFYHELAIPIERPENS